MNSYKIRPSTAKLVAKLIYPLTDSGVITIPEYREISAQLKHLAAKGELMPAIEPRLMNTAETAAALGIGVSNLKKMLRDGTLDLPKRRIGTAVRFRSTDVTRLIMSDD